MQSQLIHSCITNLKQLSPLVHNITNFVANNTAANILLAAGASPAMVCDIKEAPEFVLLARALTINIGTLTQDSLSSMLATTKVAHENHIPWVLDPVAVGATTFRQQACQELIKFKPDVIRGNASEILALAGMNSQSKGADSGDSVDAAKAAAKVLTQYAKVVVVTGAVDWVATDSQGWSIHHGHPLMARVTATGCGLTSLIGAFIGANHTKRPVSTDAIAAATVSALCYYGQAGEIAAQKAEGAGSFYVHFLDALYNIDADRVSKNAKINI